MSDMTPQELAALPAVDLVEGLIESLDAALARIDRDTLTLLSARGWVEHSLGYARALQTHAGRTFRVIFFPVRDDDLDVEPPAPDENYWQGPEDEDEPSECRHRFPSKRCQYCGIVE